MELFWVKAQQCRSWAEKLSMYKLTHRVSTKRSLRGEQSRLVFQNKLSTAASYVLTDHTWKVLLSLQRTLLYFFQIKTPMKNCKSCTFSQDCNILQLPRILNGTNWSAKRWTLKQQGRSKWVCWCIAPVHRQFESKMKFCRILYFKCYRIKWYIHVVLNDHCLL